MEEVEIISRCLVGASERSINGVSSRIELTPWDLQFIKAGPIQKGLLFHNPTPQQQQSRVFTQGASENIAGAYSLVNHLKTSLSSTLSFFPTLAGRFATSTVDNNASVVVYVDCNDAGVEFVHAKATAVTVSTILGHSENVPHILRSFFPLNGVTNCDGFREPLLGVQVTALFDGFFVACTLNHCLADGTSFWNFFNSWSELSRGANQLSRTPVLERWFPDNINPPIHIPLVIENNVFTRQPFPERVFHLSKENISKLKSKANSEMGTSNASSSISSLQSYMAHLWRAVTRARNLESNEDVHLLIVIGARTRLPLPEGYWGNAASITSITAKAGELLGKGLGWTAWKIKEEVWKQSDEELVNQYVSWVKSPRFFGEEKFPGNALAMGSSPRFNVYGTDFGWGKPVAVRSGIANKLDGKVTLFPGSDEGSVDIELCLHSHTLLGLENDREFLEYVTIQGN